MTRSANPLLDALRQAASGDEAARDDAIRRYGFAVPDGDALAAIAERAPAGVVEIGAGTGYWAAQLAGYGVDVVAYDPEPAPSPANRWFAGAEPWFEVAAADHRVVERHPDRLLLLVWPTRNETWAADAVTAHARAGGRALAYVGEGPGGRTGDDRFHALLGEIDQCLHCTYGVADTACTCGVTPLWRRSHLIDLPRWPGCDDRLHIYARSTNGTPTPGEAEDTPRPHRRGLFGRFRRDRSGRA
ncbi:MAG: hypothetical protein ACK5PP_02695 [Acidimicrobiales bacterium]